MSQLLSSPPMAVFSKTFINHQFTDARFPSSRSIFTSGGFTGKIVPLKPTARLKLTVKSRQDDYFEKKRFGDSSSSPQNSSRSLIVWILKNVKHEISESLNFCLFGFIAEGSSPRFYVGHSIYKGKAALTIEPRAPEFVALEVCLSFGRSKALLYLSLYVDLISSFCDVFDPVWCVQADKGRFFVASVCSCSWCSSIWLE